MTAEVLQTSCGVLTVASLVAIGLGSPVVTAHDGAAAVESVYAAIPTDWNRAGPLAIPSIGVVPPGLEDWYDPLAPRSAAARYEAPPALSATATRAPVRSIEERSPATPTGTRPGTTAPARVTPPPAQSPDSTPPTTAPETTTPETTTPGTTTPPVTDETPTTTEPPTPTEEPPPPVETSTRGNVVLGLGAQFTVLDGDATVLAVAVDSVVADVSCTGTEALPAVNGHLIAVQLRVTTGSDLTSLGVEPAVQAADFSFVGADGVTIVEAGTDSAASCVPDTEALPTGPLAPDQELAGTVVLDVPATTGTLVLAPDFLASGAEWGF